MHPPDARDDAGAGRLAVVHTVRRQRRDLQKGAALVEQLVDALPRQQLASRHMALPRLLRTTEGSGGESLPELTDERRLTRGVVGERGRCRIHEGLELLHGSPACTQLTVDNRLQVSRA